MQNEHSQFQRTKFSLFKKAAIVGFCFIIVILISVAAILLFRESLMNKFIKPEISKAFAEAYPAYSLRIGHVNFSISQNRFEFDSIVVNSVDDTFSGNIGSFSVSGIEWKYLFLDRKISSTVFVKSFAKAENIVLNFPQSQYKLRCKQLYVSVPNSEIVADSLEFHPLKGDEEFFRKSKFRRTRFNVVTHHCSMNGIAFLELKKKVYRSRSVQIHNADINILVNKDKPDEKETPSPLMPNEILSSIKGILQIDSVSILNARLNYAERITTGSKPAMITFDHMKMLAEGITNHGDRNTAIRIHAQGIFMKSGTMDVSMTIPIAMPEFSYQYSGSLKGLELRNLNSFLETAEQIRIKDGFLRTATFEVNVISGRASGAVRTVYRNLTLAFIDKNTRSESGFSDGIKSFIANTFKIHGTNEPDKSGSLKIGVVNFTRTRENPFFQFTWFALRSGVKDIVGF